MYVGTAWKPFQKGIIVTTTSFLKLSELLLKLDGFKFTIGCHFNSNCVENVFSIVRKIQKAPNALQITHALKAIILAQHFKIARGSSYEEDLGELLSGILDISRRRKEKHGSGTSNGKLSYMAAENNLLLNLRQQNILFYVCGYLIDSVCVKLSCF